ncbi:hypothetical protein [Metabacillus fastidiosus]|uniref:hypothetical protein n=1 Tax=Metabacillus fastidiosus TaxID=1458 RepID=UPI003D29A749
MKRLTNLSLIIVLTVLFVNMMGCSSTNEVSSNTYSFTQEEEKQFFNLAYDSLEDSLQNNIIDSEKGEITVFKSGSKFEIFTNKNNERKNIKDIQTISVTFATKKESKLKSIQVYLDENGENVLGFITENKKGSSN